MKVRSFVIIILGLFSVIINNNAQPNLIYYWHFNNTLPADGSGGLFYGPILFMLIMRQILLKHLSFTGL